MKVADVARLTQEDWQAERDRQVDVCRQCHSERHVRQNLDAADQLIREMAGNIDESFVITESWAKVRRRIVRQGA